MRKESKIDRFPECFANWMNAVAFTVIFVIIIVFLYSIFSSKNIEIIKQNRTEIVFKPTGNEKLDVEKFNSIIDLKLKEFKEETKNSDKERNENMKYYSALVGFILSIVGLFGFKSMHDTRQAAIEKAVFDAKKEATEVARKIAKDISEGIASKEAKSVAITTSKNEINRFLTDEKEEIFRLLENPIKETYDPVILEYKDRLDKLERPGIYNKEINEFNDKLFRFYSEMTIRINNLEKELIEKEVELLKLKNPK